MRDKSGFLGQRKVIESRVVIVIAIGSGGREGESISEPGT